MNLLSIAVFSGACVLAWFLGKDVQTNAKAFGALDWVAAASIGAWLISVFAVSLSRAFL